MKIDVILLKLHGRLFVLKCRINNKSTLVQIMAWRRTADKPLSEQMMCSSEQMMCSLYASFGFNELIRMISTTK